MTPEQFTNTVLSRASSQYNRDLADFDYFFATCLAFVAAAERLDMFKKALFYGKRMDSNTAIISKLPPLHDVKSRAVLHGVIGAATEAGELVAAMLKWLETTKGGEMLPDVRTNCIEELGDMHWYLALMQSGMALSHSTVWEANDRKLATRYGEAFSAEAALTRDNEAEDAALKGE